MYSYSIRVIKESANKCYCLFECSNGDWGIFEPRVGDYSIGDQLYLVRPDDRFGCGIYDCLLGNVRCCISIVSCGFKEDMIEEYNNLL